MKTEIIVKDAVKSLVILTSDHHNSEAVDEAIKLASSGISGTTVYLKYVEDSDPSKEIYLEKGDYDERKKRAQQKYEKYSQRLIDVGLDVEVLTPHFGIAAEEILRVEKQLGLDIIIITAPKRSICGRILRGAHFSKRVSCMAMTPTLIVNPSNTRRI